MKIYFCLTLLCTLHITASVYSQNELLDLEVKGKSVREVFKEIEANSEFRFFYNDDFSSLNKTVDIIAQQKGIDEILTQLLTGADVAYKIMADNMVVILPASEMQQARLTGTVTDASTGEPLPGVYIRIEGTNTGGVSAADGTYSIALPGNGTVLQFSFVGYITRTIPFDGTTIINVALEPEISQLDEVVVVGYGVQRKSNVTGAIASVKADDLQNRSTTDVGKALQGKVSGVQVLTMSGAPGSGATFRVRGYSNNTSSDPLYIVDGLKVENINYLDPNNIGSIEVLKDAASAAIYGAEAGNGVVLITTKKGASGTSRLFFNARYANQQQAKKLTMMNAQEFKDYWSYNGIAESSFQNGNTDWNDVVFEDGSMKTYTLGAEGGNEKGSFFTSFTYNNDNGMVTGNTDINKRIAAQINADYNIKPWLKIGTNTSIERGKTVTVSSNNFTGTGSVIGGSFYDPTVPLYYDNDADYQAIDPSNNLGLLTAEASGFHTLRNENDQLYGSSFLMQSNLWNPLGMIENFTNEAWRTNINGSAYTELKPVNGLVYTSRIGYRYGNSFISNYTDNYWWNRNQNRPSASLESGLTHTVYYQWENFVNYSLSYGKNEINALLGMQYSNNNMANVRGTTDALQSNFTNYRYIEYSSATANDNLFGRNYNQRSISYFGRLEWSFANKYMLQGSYRADAYDASKLPKDNRWGYFPSISGGWVLTEENFIKNLGLTPLSFFKIRASWGVNGNVDVLDNYPYTSLLNLGSNYYSFTNQLYTGAAPANLLPNSDLTWEKSKQTDIGFESRFLNNRLAFSMDYFYKLTDGLLLANAAAPSVSGNSATRKNIGKIENSGFEFELSWRDEIGDFGYSVSGNLSTLHNEVIESPYGEGRFAGGGGFLSFIGGGGTYFEKGYPIWYLRVNMLDHIDESNGQPIWKTAEQLGTDDGLAPAGSAIPNFTYGITLNADYKGFDLRLFGTGQQGSELLFAVVRPDLPNMNMPDFLVEDYWTPQNTDAKTPGAQGFASNSARIAQSDLLVFNSSFFKIKEIQLGYNIPGKYVNKIKISSLRLYASLENFITFTKYKGLDPESMASTAAGETFTIPGGATLQLGGGMGVDRIQYPSMKQVIFGINVSF